jgi:hypothetical protein
MRAATRASPAVHVLVRGPAMSAFGVVPEPRARVTKVGSVTSVSGRPLAVGVNGGLVTIGGLPFNREQCETFAQLFLRAVWLAGHDKEAV